MFRRTSLEGVSIWILLLLLTGGCSTVDSAGDSSADLTTKVDPETSKVATTATSLPETRLFFPQQPDGVDYPMADIRGRLFLDDEDCIRLNESDGTPPPTLLWPANFDLQAEGDDIRILDRRGRLVGRIGERVDLGGGAVPRNYLDEDSLKDGKVLELFERCPGSYWLVAE